MSDKVKIALDECRHGFLYKIESRNLAIGVYDTDSKGFIGIRTKFNFRYLFTELHWDACPTFGTVKPLELLEECPHKLDHESEVLFDWLNDRLENYHSLGLLPSANLKRAGDFSVKDFNNS